MIVADTGGVIALLNGNDKHHDAVLSLFEKQGRNWVLPWAILPEVDHLTRRSLGHQVADAFAEDVRDHRYRIDANARDDMARAVDLMKKYDALHIGLVDAVVMAQAERHAARVIVTTDARHFRAVTLKLDPPPRLVPLDP